MGILCLCREGSNMMRLVISACLVAMALADADPYYGAYGYGAVAAHVPFGSSTGLDAFTQGFAPYAHYGYAHYGKRSADAYYPYAHHAVVAHVPFGSSTGLDPITQGLDPVT